MITIQNNGINMELMQSQHQWAVLIFLAVVYFYSKVNGNYSRHRIGIITEIM